MTDTSPARRISPFLPDFAAAGKDKKKETRFVTALFMR